MPGQPMDLLISATEINDHHGVGILLQRFFSDSGRFVTLRSLTLYGGEEKFGVDHHALSSAYLSPAETEQRLRQILASSRIRRILCVPYTRQDFVHGILARKITGAPLCTYIMDDQNIYTRGVPDHWVRDLLKQSDVCLGISPELCAAYQRKYQRPFHLLPPLVERITPLVPCYWQPGGDPPHKVAMIGNIWTARRFVQLRAVLRDTGINLDWYGNGAVASWLPGDPLEWEQDHIRCLGHLPEDDLVAALAGYPCILVPSGTLDAEDDNVSFSRLSLPSRLVFLHTRTDTPVLVLGSPDTAAGRFVRHLGTGLCAPYQARELMAQLTRIQTPQVHREARLAVRRHASQLVLPDAGQWLWDTLARRAPTPAPFHDLFPPVPGDAGWLQAIPPLMSGPNRKPNVSKTQFSDVDMRYFAFLRQSHLPVLRASENQVSYVALGYELSQLMQRLLGFLFAKILPAGGNYLFLGTSIPTWTDTLPPDVTGWRIQDMMAWQMSGFSPAPEHFTGIAGPAPARPGKFDAILSSSWLYNITAAKDLSRLTDFLTQQVHPGGFNLHADTAVLHPEFFWWPLAYARLRTAWGMHDWPGLEDILTSPDVFFMSADAYAKFWEHKIGKTYEDFGRPLGVTLFWRRPGTDQPGDQTAAQSGEARDEPTPVNTP